MNHFAATKSDSYCCLICYEDCAGVVEFAKLDPCRHGFCRSCLREHAKHAILARKQIPVPCPCRNEPSVECRTELNQNDVEALLSRAKDDPSAQRAWKIFDRLERLRLNPALIPCPWCAALVEDTRNDKKRSELICTACHKAFIVPQHQKKARKAADSKSEKAIRRSTRPCSHCGTRLQKTAGCDHVLCPACGNDMCYGCGTHVHLTGKVIRTCSKCQQGYVDHRYEWMYRCYVIALLPIAIPCVLIYMVGMLLLSTISCCFCGCFASGKMLIDPPSPDPDYADQPDCIRAISFGVSLFTAPVVIILQDLGCCRQWRMPHEIYHGVRLGREMNGTFLPQFSTLEVERDEDIESRTNSATEHKE